MRPARPVDEFEVHEHRLAVPAKPDRYLRVTHLVEVQRRIPLRSDRAVHDRAGQRRHVHLRLDPGHCDLGDLADLGRQSTLFDQEHIGGEPRAFVHRLDVGDHAGDLDRLLPRAGHRPLRHYHIIKLGVLPGRQPDRELQRSGRHRADHQPKPFLPSAHPTPLLATPSTDAY